MNERPPVTTREENQHQLRMLRPSVRWLFLIPRKRQSRHRDLRIEWHDTRPKQDPALIANRTQKATQKSRQNRSQVPLPDQNLAKSVGLLAINVLDSVAELQRQMSRQTMEGCENRTTVSFRLSKQAGPPGKRSLGGCG